MSLRGLTREQRRILGNALDRASAHVRKNEARFPVNYPDSVDLSLTDLKVLLDAAIAASSTDVTG